MAEESQLDSLSRRIAETDSAAALRALGDLDRARRRLQRGQPADRLLSRAAGLIERGEALVAERAAAACTISYPEELPVSGHRQAIIDALTSQRCLVLVGATGSGKTTQLPKMLMEAGFGHRGRIAVTQPRRLAALSVARRLAEECEASEPTIAHAVRFDDRSADASRVVVCTDGLLLAEMAKDRSLSRYDAIVVDEAHERSCNVDVLLGLLRRLRHERPDLAVVVTSATIDAGRFAEFLAGDDGATVPIVEVPGRLFPVEIRHRDPADGDLGYLDGAIDCLEDLHRDEDTGDVLCFLPTERDILEARRRLDRLAGAVVVPCFGRLTPGEQQRIFETVRGRKIVLATPIAETSLTVPGIRFVVDAGLARLKRYNPGARTERLPVEAVSQASLAQRSGRAGRLGPGICVRLFSADDEAARPEFTEPELLRSNLAGVLLQLLGMGFGDGAELPWIDAPRPGAWRQARDLLDELGALEGDGLSPLGRRLARIPADPQVARILLAGVDEGVAHEACTIAAFCSVQEPRVRPVGEEAKADQAQARFKRPEGDLATVLALYDAWQEASSSSARRRLCEGSYLGFRRMREWADVRRQLWQSLSDSGLARALPNHGNDAAKRPWDRIHRAVLAGMLGQVLMRDREARCWRAAGNRECQLHPSSVLRPSRKNERRSDGKSSTPAAPVHEWLVACEIVETSRTFARLCAPIDPAWVVDLAGDRLKRSHSDPYFDADRGRVLCRQRISWKGLPVVQAAMVPAERVVGDAAAETCFIAQALAADGIPRPPKALAPSMAVLREANTLAVRLRDRSLELDEDDRVAAWSAALRRCERADDAPPLTSVKALARLLKPPQALALQERDVHPLGRWRQARKDFPTEIKLSGGWAQVDWRFTPGDADDGATITIREALLPRLESWRCERLIPGLVPWQVEAWLRTLPKEQRRQLGALEHAALRLADAALDGAEPLAQSVAAAIAQELGIDEPRFQASQLPEWSRPRFRVLGGDGSEQLLTRDPALLAGGEAADDPLAALRARWGSEPSRQWPGDCPRAVGSGSISARVVLVRARDAQARVAVRRTVIADPAAAVGWHHDGVRALIEASLDDELGDLGSGARRGLALAAVCDGVDSEQLIDAPAWQALAEDLPGRFAACKPRVIALHRSIEAAESSLAKSLKRGAKGLDGAARLSRMAAARDRLVGGRWWEEFHWTALTKLPDWLDAAAAPPAPKTAERAALMATEWEELRGDLPQALVRVAGGWPDWQEARYHAEACIAAYSRGQRPGAGANQLRFRQLLDGLRSAAAAVDEGWYRAAAELKDLQPWLARHAGPVAERLRSDLEERLRRGLDMGVGGDPAAQALAAASLAQRIRRLLGR